MPEENIIEFPEAANEDAPIAPMRPPVTYHYAAFRVGKDGQTTWFDGIAGLNDVILSQEQYLGLKKLLAEHYDVPETNFVISSLTRLDTLQFEVPVAEAPKAEVTA